MRNGEWIFCNSGNKGVSFAWTPGLLSKSRFLHIHEPGSGASRPICIFCHPLGTYLSTYYTSGSDSWRNFYCWVFPRPLHMPTLLAVTLRALLKNASDIPWVHFNGTKIWAPSSTKNHCAFSHSITSVDHGGSREIRSSPTIQQFLKHKNNCALKKQSAGLLRFTYNWRHHVVC